MGNVAEDRTVMLVCEDRHLEELPDGSCRQVSLPNKARCNRWTPHRRTGAETHALVYYELWACSECGTPRVWGSVG